MSLVLFDLIEFHLHWSYLIHVLNVSKSCRYIFHVYKYQYVLEVPYRQTLFVLTFCTGQLYFISFRKLVMAWKITTKWGNPTPCQLLLNHAIIGNLWRDSTAQLSEITRPCDTWRHNEIPNVRLVSCDIQEPGSLFQIIKMISPNWGMWITLIRHH